MSNEKEVILDVNMYSVKTKTQELIDAISTAVKSSEQLMSNIDELRLSNKQLKKQLNEERSNNKILKNNIVSDSQIVISAEVFCKVINILSYVESNEIIEQGIVKEILDDIDKNKKIIKNKVVDTEDDDSKNARSIVESWMEKGSNGIFSQNLIEMIINKQRINR